MTIDSDWVQIMKGECPDSFTASPPFVPEAAYIDGMPLLMAAGTTRRWDDLVKRNFAGPVSRYFRMNAKTVILAFDDYKFVPEAKSITQANRTKVCGKSASFEFNERQHLETVMPADYNERLRNRCYKRKVIDLIAETVIDSIKLGEGQKLIIDYVDCPVKFQLDPSTKKPKHEFMTDIPPMGECDVKFTRWSRMLDVDTMIAHSVDGDFIPIALMEYEKQVNTMISEASTNSRKNSRESGPCSIAIFRMEYNMEPTKSKSEDKNMQKKNSKDNSQKNSQKSVSLSAVGGKIQLMDSSSGEKIEIIGNHSYSTNSTNSTNSIEKKKKKRTMEYVNIPLLFHTLSECMRQCNPTTKHSQKHSECYMRLLCSLIALTGTDFTRKLPQISPKKVWDLIPVKTVWTSLLEAFDTEKKQLFVNPIDETGVGELVVTPSERLVATLYSVKFSNHVPPGFSNSNKCSMESILCAIKRSKLSEKTKLQIPSRRKVDVTIRNSNWLLQYWECRQPAPNNNKKRKNNLNEDEEEPWDYTRCFPDPICDEFGFKRSKKRKNAIQWLDDDDS